MKIRDHIKQQSWRYIDRDRNKKNIRCACLECHYIYDPQKGDPRQGIPPGTAWQDVPDEWHCPECKILKAKKGVFKPIDE